MSAPLLFAWEGDVMRPLPRFAKEADKRFVIGERYRMDVIEERSANSHNHFFASLNDAWHNLPEDEAERFPTPDHLRKWCLIRAGYADHRSIVCASKAEAQRVAAFIKPMDEFAVVTVSGPVVNVFTAQSQSMKAMGKAAFQDSKTKALEIAWAMAGVDLEQATQHAGRAA